MTTDNIVTWVLQLNAADRGYFKIQTLQVTLKIRNQLWVDFVHFWMSNICTDQLDVQEANVSVSESTESEIISLDAGLRMDGIPDLDLRDVVIEVLHSLNNVPPTPKLLHPKANQEEPPETASTMPST